MKPWRLVRLPSTLFGQISTVLVALLLAFAVTFSVAIFKAWFAIAAEQAQRTQWTLAEDLAQRIELQAVGLDEVPYQQIRSIVHEAQQLNSNIDTYLVDSEGTILENYSPENSTRRQLLTFDVAILRQFLSDTERRFVPHLHRDPAYDGRLTTFSAAELTLPGFQGYLVVTLLNPQARRFASLSLESQAFSMLLIALSILTASTAAVGLLIFRRLTKRFQTVTSAIRAYDRGEHETEIAIEGEDELAEVSRAVASMVSSIRGFVGELMQKDELRRELLLNVWHDLRGPVTSIRGHIELLELKFEKNLEYQQYFETLAKNMNLLERMLTELLELSRLEAKEITPEFRSVEIHELLSSVKDRFTLQAAQLGVDISAQSTPSTVRAWCDAVLMQRVLGNLVENALRHSSTGGTIALTAARSGDSVTIVVKDSGEGIAEEHLPHLFQRSFQAGPRTGARGLGLAIVKKVVEAHQSTITVESELGKGTSFQFSLPIDDTGDSLQPSSGL